MSIVSNMFDNQRNRFDVVRTPKLCVMMRCQSLRSKIEKTSLIDSSLYNAVMNYILIDGSYFIFFRYYALCVWYKLRKQPDTLDAPYESETFMEKFSRNL